MPDDRPGLTDLQSLLPIESWRIYYADGAVVDGAATDEWRAAPAAGVLAVTAYHGEGYSTAFHGHDRYWLPGYHYWPKTGITVGEDDLEMVLDRVEQERS